MNLKVGDKIEVQGCEVEIYKVIPSQHSFTKQKTELALGKTKSGREWVKVQFINV